MRGKSNQKKDELRRKLNLSLTSPHVELFDDATSTFERQLDFSGFEVPLLTEDQLNSLYSDLNTDALSSEFIKYLEHLKKQSHIKPAPALINLLLEMATSTSTVENRSLMINQRLQERPVQISRASPSSPILSKESKSIVSSGEIDSILRKAEHRLQKYSGCFTRGKTKRKKAAIENFIDSLKSLKKQMEAKPLQRGIGQPGMQKVIESFGNFRTVTEERSSSCCSFWRQEGMSTNENLFFIELEESFISKLRKATPFSMVPSL